MLILSQAMSVRYIDFCAAHGIAFHAVVAGEQHAPWYHQTKVGLFPGPDTDATRVRTDLDMGALRRYATEKGVGLWTWVHHGAVRGRVDAVFAAFERLGWNGVMVDFLDSDDQETVEFAEAVLAAAARHHVLVHFHGMYKPTGLQRTFPNLMNHEGALNLEYLKWADSCTPEHALGVAFTRLVAGPVDYHLGGFRAVRPADFKPTFTAPQVLGTRGHQLGLYVCFDNPAPMVADYPAAYRDQAGFDFVTAVPTWWDETRVLVGEIGRVLVTARRRGQAWFVGGIGAGPTRELVVPDVPRRRESVDASLARRARRRSQPARDHHRGGRARRHTARAPGGRRRFRRALRADPMTCRAPSSRVGQTESLASIRQRIRCAKFHRNRCHPLEAPRIMSTETANVHSSNPRGLHATL